MYCRGGITIEAVSYTHLAVQLRGPVCLGVMPVSYTHLDVYKRQTYYMETIQSYKILRKLKILFKFNEIM